MDWTGVPVLPELNARDFIRPIVRQPNGWRVSAAIDLNVANLRAARRQRKFREFFACRIKPSDPV